QDRRRKGGQYPRLGRRYAARRRSRLPPQHGRQAGAAGRHSEGPPRRRGAGRHGRPSGHRRGREALRATSRAFKTNARAAMGDANLQRAMANLRSGFVQRRAVAVSRLPEWEALRDEGIAIKKHTLAHLDFYLEAFEKKVVAAGGQVHWARD